MYVPKATDLIEGATLFKGEDGKSQIADATHLLLKQCSLQYN